MQCNKIFMTISNGKNTNQQGPTFLSDSSFLKDNPELSGIFMKLLLTTLFSTLECQFNIKFDFFFTLSI